MTTSAADPALTLTEVTRQSWAHLAASARRGPPQVEYRSARDGHWIATPRIAAHRPPEPADA